MPIETRGTPRDFVLPPNHMTPRRYDRRALDKRVRPKGSGHDVHVTTPLELAASDSLRAKLRTVARAISGGDGPASLDLPTVPGVQSLAIAMRYIDGGREQFIEFVQMAALNGVECVKKWWLVYADLTPGERARVSFDDVCVASGVRPSELMANVVAVAMEFSTDVGNLVAAATHPAIVHQAAKSAKRIGGVHAQIGLADRRMLLDHARFLPVPKGASVHVHANASANAAAAANAANDPSVPSFADDMLALGAPRRAVQSQIEASPAGSTDDLMTPVARDAVLVTPQE